MKIKTGIDIIEVERVKNVIEEHGETFLNKVFTQNEINYCKDTKKLMYQHYAVRFAAKEAVFKAISDLLDEKYEIEWNNIETLVSKEGKPKVNFVNLDDKLSNRLSKIQSMDISLSHIEKTAVASVCMIIDE